MFRKFVNWVKNSYKRNRRNREATVVVKPVKVSEGTNLTWGRVICHNSHAQGADTVRNGELVTENMHCKMTYGFMKYFTYVGTRDVGGIKGAYSHIYRKGCNASLESHRNAFNGKAKGFEVLVLRGDETSKRYAQILMGIFGKHYPDRTYRRIKELRYGEGGYKNLRTARDLGFKVAILPELFFIDNEKEWITPEDLAKIYDEFFEATAQDGTLRGQI